MRMYLQRIIPTDDLQISSLLDQLNTRPPTILSFPTTLFRPSLMRAFFPISCPPPRYYCTKLFSPPSNKLPSLAAPQVGKLYHRYHTTTRRRCQKIVVIMGPTGCGKSRLSIDLATRFFPSSEIINSDKIQVYRGLDITTNKIPLPDRRGVHHHLLGHINPSNNRHLTPSEYRSLAVSYISAISSRGKLPLIVGGSNSLIHALVTSRFNPDSDVFRETDPDPVSTELRYDCCFLWVDVAIPVLNEYLERRVDEMMGLGMVGELEKYFDSDEFRQSESGTGLRQAIGVPEFEPYFQRFSSSAAVGGDYEAAEAYEEAVRAIKDNTCQLAKRQLGKIQRLRCAGWDLRRVDATEVFRAAMGLGGGSDSGSRTDIWEKQVLEPSVKIVKRFLHEKRTFRIPTFHFGTMKRVAPLSCPYQIRVLSRAPT